MSVARAKFATVRQFAPAPAWATIFALSALLLGQVSCGGGREKNVKRGKVNSQKLAQPDTRVPSSAIRRLSVKELRNTLLTLTNTSPQALEQLPPDSLTHSFDRVVNSQTMSPAHVDAYLAIAAETTDILLNERRLDQLSDACRDEFLPSARDEETTNISGNALSLDPDWSVAPPSKPQYSKTRYAPSPTVTYNHHFDATGSYGMEFSFHSNSRVDLEVLVDGRSVAKESGLRGQKTVSSRLQVLKAQGHSLEFKFSTSPEFHNLEINFQKISMVGPTDAKARRHKKERLACARGLVQDFAPRAYRRDLAKAEQETLNQLYARVSSSDGSVGGLRTLMQAILTSPYFLHLIEVGQAVPGEAGLYKLNSQEMASRLSYAICEEPPDAPLRRAASSDELTTPKQIEAQATRLFAKPCAETTVLRFFEHWLWLNRLPTLNKSPDTFPQYTSDVREGMRSEARRFLREMVWGQSDLQTLLSANYGWPDPRSAFLYGKSNIATNKKTRLPGERAGVLTLPGVLAVTSTFDSTSPVKRGIFILDQLLCDKPPSPPPEFDITPPLPDPKATTRERWAFHTGPNACATCHQSIDPIGFAFEEFDGIGQHRRRENGLAIDSKGGIPSIGVVDGSLSGAAPVARILADAPEVASCLAKQWLRFSLGRLETPADGSTLAQQTKAFQRKSLKEALLSMLTSEAFAHRREPGGQP
jgi:hypothetical protein